MVWGSIFKHPFSNPGRLFPEPVPVSGHCAQRLLASRWLPGGSVDYCLRHTGIRAIIDGHHSKTVSSIAAHVPMMALVAARRDLAIYPLHDGQATAANMATVATTPIQHIS